MSDPKESKDVQRANAAFQKKETQQREGAIAMAEYQAGLKAERAKTEKLRALRLAKEAEDARKAAMKAAMPKVVPKPATKMGAPKPMGKVAAKPAVKKTKKRK